MTEMLQQIQYIYNPDTRERAFSELTKNREKKYSGLDLGPALWYSVGIMPIFLQELVAIYPLINSKDQMMGKRDAHRVSNMITLIHTIALHDGSRKQLLDSQICLFLYPLLRAPPNERNDVIRLTVLGVIGALLRYDDQQVISYLLNSEMFPLCLDIMEAPMDTSSNEQQNDLPKVLAAYVVHKLLTSEHGLAYACHHPDRFTAIAKVLHTCVSRKDAKGKHICSSRLLRHTIRCYLRLADNPQVSPLLPSMLPEELKNSTFKEFLESDAALKNSLLQLLVKVGDMGARRIVESERAK
ncbi:CCR4-NOT transcription complex subunit 9 [Strigomonas culicis]|nr:CCR4-NOT transcription complex subunit 9 [Strigomonas culicis]|eukprot:EPY36108.1 CCR4-NOT transcription complex subunit 9 [Strigomonas culicis]